MPTYEYACTECGHHVEVVQSMSDAPLQSCSICGGRLRKVFSPIGVVFKGSGFYRTDSRPKPAATGKEKPGAGGAKPEKSTTSEPTATKKATEKTA
jgi:putative FmdB family regulatory protein